MSTSLERTGGQPLSGKAFLNLNNALLLASIAVAKRVVLGKVVWVGGENDSLHLWYHNQPLPLSCWSFRAGSFWLAA